MLDGICNWDGRRKTSGEGNSRHTAEGCGRLLIYQQRQDDPQNDKIRGYGWMQTFAEKYRSAKK